MGAIEDGVVQRVANQAIATLRDSLTLGNPLSDDQLTDIIEEAVIDTIETLSLGPLDIGEQAAYELAERAIERVTEIVNEPTFRRLYEPKGT